MSALKNPCLSCDHHLAGGDKNVWECNNCKERIAYVNAIGTCPGESVNENISLEGSAGGTDAKKILNETEEMTNQEIKDPQSEKSIDNQQSTIIDPIEDHIKTICQDASMTVDQIRVNAKDIQDKQALQLFHETRDRIIKDLASGEFGKMSQMKIGKHLDVSLHTISIRMGKMGISPMYSVGAQRNRKRLFKKKIPDIPTPVPIPPKPKESDIPQNMMLNLNLADYPEIYDDLQALATQEIRTVEGQALYIFKQLHERGLNVKEL